MLTWSVGQARAFLEFTHFNVKSIDEYFGRLAAVQYDPLKPFGRNIDLVFQSRLPRYRVDAWERAVYGEWTAGDRSWSRRAFYDAWDKQACIVPMSDWPWRRIYHRWHEPFWRNRVLDSHREAAAIVREAVRERGPCTSDDLIDLKLPGDAGKESRTGSWFGPRLVNHLLKGLWFIGGVVTHHRTNGRHVYSVPEEVIPPELINAPQPPEHEAIARIIVRRVQSVGLLRENAHREVWSLPLSAAERRKITVELSERDGNVWRINRVWWEDGSLQEALRRPSGRRVSTDAFLAAFGRATDAFVRYLGALEAVLPDELAAPR